MSDLGTRVRDDRTGDEGMIIQLGGDDRALISWADGRRADWVPRRHLMLCICGPSPVGSCLVHRADTDVDYLYWDEDAPF